MKNFKKIISGISAMVICGCSMSCPIMVTANDGMNYVTEGIIDEAPAEVNIPIGSTYPRGTAGYEVFRAMTYAIHYTGDVSLWTDEQIDYWNTYWGDFYSSLLFIYQNSTSQKMFDESFFNLIGYPTDNAEWTQGQKEEYASLYQVMFLELRVKLPNIMPEIVISTETTEPMVTTTDIMTIPETTSTVTETTTDTSESVLITTSLETTTFTEALMSTFTSTEGTSTSTSTSVENITSTSSTGTNVVTTVTTSNIKNDEIPKTGDKGIFKVIGIAIGIAAGIAALCVGNFVIGKRK